MGNGVGDPLKKGRLSGINLARRKEGGVQEELKEATVWVCGKPLGKTGRIFDVDPAMSQRIGEG